MCKQKAIIITAMVLILLGAVLFQISSNSIVAERIVLGLLAIPGYLYFGQALYKWVAESPKKEEAPDNLDLLEALDVWDSE